MWCGLSPGHGRAGADRGRGLLPAAPEMVPGPRLPVARGLGLLWPGRHRAAAASRRTWSASGPCWRPSSRARPIPIFAKDREGRYIILNSAAAQRPSDARDTTVIGLTDADVFPPETAAALRDQELRIMETGATEVLEETIPDRHRGEPRVFLTTKTPLRDPAGAIVGIIGVARDITERKAAEEALRRAKEEAERANLAKSKFLAAASHDLRQPLQSLILFAGVLKGYVQGPRGEQALKQLEHGLGALKALLDSLLDVSQLDAGIVKPEITDFPISAVLDEIAASYAPIAAAKGLGWQVESCTDGVRSDMTLLGRVLRNLVENAVRYTKSGHIRIVCRRIEDRLRIEVEDTGIGIPPEQLDRIFEEFHQVGNQARDRTQGLGLGLAIVRRIADLLGHRIETRSRPGEGSIFSIELPLAMTEAAAAAGLRGRRLGPEWPRPVGRGDRR